MQRTKTLFVAVVAFVVVAFVVAGSGAVGTVDGSASGDSGVPTGGFEQMDVDPDDVLIEVSVDSDGDAAWEIQYRVRLATDDEEQAFEELREDIEADPGAYADRFRERMVATADTAQAATGREMEVTETTVTAERRELPQSYGVVTYRFQWSGFAAIDGDRVVVGDAIDGLFLDDASSLIVSWPDGYGLVDATPSPTETRDGAVVWAGPVDFTEGEPRITVEPDGLAVGPVALLVVGLLVLGGGAVAYRRRRGGSAVAADDGDGGESPPEAGVTETSEPARNADAEGTTDATVGSADTAAEPSASAESGGPSTSPADEALLSNEEQVLQLVESNGGRMKQKHVAEELGWTAAKTSQVVTGLRDGDELDGFRLGRENVLSLPDYEAGADSQGDVESGSDGEDDPGK